MTKHTKTKKAITVYKLFGCEQPIWFKHDAILNYMNGNTGYIPEVGLE